MGVSDVEGRKNSKGKKQGGVELQCKNRREDLLGRPGFYLKRRITRAEVSRVS